MPISRQIIRTVSVLLLVVDVLLSPGKKSAAKAGDLNRSPKRAAPLELRLKNKLIN